ncbi:hypothetical protein UYO_0121 [Lachnospiraceae bacterium JC7]|nr:hypothetical protein UYO_0121 [Lachnospiraceae bacterium JC7]
MKQFKSSVHIIIMAMTMALCTAFSALAEFGPGAVTEDTVIYTEVKADRISDPIAEKLGKTMTSQLTDQIILVNDHNLTLWNRQSDGSWEKDMDVYCGYGRNGLKPYNERKEGDQTTPIGSFPILHSFGFGSNPGTAMTWREITENSYWSGEKATYNTWVESSTPVGGEHLSEYTICYKYAMAIGFNINPTVYKRGSAIFLHCKNPAEWGSAGCVSVTEDNMLTLLKKCHDGCYIMIVPNEDYISNF